VTKFAIHKIVKLIDGGKLTFDEMVEVHRGGTTKLNGMLYEANRVAKRRHVRSWRVGAGHKG
jgi:hypothetical protein